MSLKSIKISSRLILGFSTVLMMLILVSTTGFYGMYRNNNALHHVVDINVKKMEYLQEMSEAVLIVARMVRTIALNEDEAARKQLIKDIEKNP